MISPGGIENPGNCCALQVVLQTFAAQPILDSMFSETLEDGAKRSLQTQIHHCVQTIRSGTVVKQREIRDIRKTMIEAGWDEDFSGIIGKIYSLFYRYLGWIPLRPMDPYLVYEFLRNSLTPDLTWQTVEAGDVRHAEIEMQNQKLIVLHRFTREASQSLGQKLTFVNQGAIEPGPLDLQKFTQIHLCLNVLFWAHSWTYRKVGDQWYSIDDDRVKPITPNVIQNLPRFLIQRLIY